MGTVGRCENRVGGADGKVPEGEGRGREAGGVTGREEGSEGSGTDTEGIGDRGDKGREEEGREEEGREEDGREEEGTEGRAGSVCGVGPCTGQDTLTLPESNNADRERDVVSFVSTLRMSRSCRHIPSDATREREGIDWFTAAAEEI